MGAVMANAARASTPESRERLHFAQGIQISLLTFAVAAVFHPSAYQFYFYYFCGLAVALRTQTAT